MAGIERGCYVRYDWVRLRARRWVIWFAPKKECIREWSVEPFLFISFISCLPIVCPAYGRTFLTLPELLITDQLEKRERKIGEKSLAFTLLFLLSIKLKIRSIFTRGKPSSEHGIRRLHKDIHIHREQLLPVDKHQEILGWLLKDFTISKVNFRVRNNTNRTSERGPSKVEHVTSTRRSREKWNPTHLSWVSVLGTFGVLCTNGRYWFLHNLAVVEADRGRRGDAEWRFFWNGGISSKAAKRTRRKNSFLSLVIVIIIIFVGEWPYMHVHFADITWSDE